MEAFAKIDPPHGEENDEAGAQGQPQLATPGVVLADGGDGSGARAQRFAKNDDRQHAVALDNMVAMPSRRVPALGESRDSHFSNDDRQTGRIKQLRTEESLGGEEWFNHG